MKTSQTALDPGEEPLAVLGVPPNASEKEIRAAYLRKVKEFPPDRHPEKFEKIRDAFQILSDPRRRARLIFDAANPMAPLASLLDEIENRKRFLGPEAWMSILKKPTRKQEPSDG